MLFRSVPQSIIIPLDNDTLRNGTEQDYFFFTLIRLIYSKDNNNIDISGTGRAHLQIEIQESVTFRKLITYGQSQRFCLLLSSFF